MNKLRDLFLDALESTGYDVLSSITLWNTEYKPEILALPKGKHIYYIGKHEITFKKV